MPIIHVESIEDARLEKYRDLKKTNLTRWSNRFIVEGKLLVERLAKSRFRIDSIVSSQDHAKAIAEMVSEDVSIYVLPKSQVNSLVGFTFHRGVLGCGIRERIDDVSTLLRANEPSTLVVCPDIVDPTNLGGIIRNCAAFGVDALILGPHCADPFSRRSIRVSMGTALRLPIVETTELLSCLRSLRENHKFRMVATVLDQDAEPLMQYRRSKNLAILFGSEGHGLGTDWKEIADHRVTLPMKLQTDSLNVTTACGIFLYHLIELG